MKKYAKKLLALAMVLAMVLSLGVSAYADEVVNRGAYLEGNAIPPNSNNPYCSTYLAPSTGNSSVSVKLIVEAGKAFSWDWFETQDPELYKEITVSASNANGVTVYDVLNNANNTNGLSFSFSSTHYLMSVSYGGNTWEEGTWGFDGWVFRVNDKYPVKQTLDELGYEGASIAETYVSNGDVIHLFYDYPSDYDDETGNIAANYIRGVYSSRTQNSVTIEMQGHKTYIESRLVPSLDDPNEDDLCHIMHVYNYEIAQGLTVGLYDLSGNPIGQVDVSDANGEVTFSVGENITLPAGTYLVKSASTYYAFDDESMWAEMLVDAYFENTSAYCFVTVPAYNPN